MCTTVTRILREFTPGARSAFSLMSALVGSQVKGSASIVTGKVFNAITNFWSPSTLVSVDSMILVGYTMIV